MSTNPNVAQVVAEAKTAFDWLKAQVASLWSAHKVAVVAIGALGFVSGCVFH